MRYQTWLKRWKKGPQWPQKAWIVGVLWEDAAHCEEKQDSGTILSFVCGTVIEADEKKMKVAFEIFEDRTERDISSIPAGMIRKVYRLGEVDFTKR